MRNKVGAALAAMLCVVVVAGCSDDKSDGQPKLGGENASLVAQADCGEDGVANVHVTYGQVDKNYLIGRNATTLTIGHGSENFDERYGLAAGDTDVLFTISTDPTRGTCTTTLTDGDKGDVLFERKSAGKISTSVLLTGK